MDAAGRAARSGTSLLRSVAPTLPSSIPSSTTTLVATGSASGLAAVRNCASSPSTEKRTMGAAPALYVQAPSSSQAERRGKHRIGWQANAKPRRFQAPGARPGVFRRQPPGYKPHSACRQQPQPTLLRPQRPPTREETGKNNVRSACQPPTQTPRFRSAQLRAPSRSARESPPRSDSPQAQSIK